MEDKKPQSTPAKATASKKVVKPTQTAQTEAAKSKQVEQTKLNQSKIAKPAQSKENAPAKPKPTVATKPAQPKENASAKPKMSATVKPAQPKGNVQIKPTQTKSAPIKQSTSVSAKTQTAKAKQRPSVWVKGDKASQTVKSKPNQSTLQKTAKPNTVGAIRSETTTSQKAIKPTLKKANTEAKAVSAKKSIPAKPMPLDKKAAATDALVAKVSNDSNAEKVEKEIKPKFSLKAWIASKCKKKPKENTAPKKVKKAEPKEETDTKETSAAVPADKRSTIAKLATKGFVVKSWQIAVAVAVVVVLVVGGVLLGTMLGNKDAKPEDPIVDYTGPIVDKDPENPSNITLPGYPVLMFPANSQKVSLELPNPNGNPCYFRYTLTIVETGDVLYESGRIDPGKMVKALTLNHALSAGTYTLRITIDTFSLDGGNVPMNGGVQEVKLIVK